MTTRKNWILTAICAAILVGCGGSDHSTPATTATDPDTAADQRAAALVAQMTLDEKIQMVHGVGVQLPPVGATAYIPGISRLGIPDFYTTDSATGAEQIVNGVPVDNGATAMPSPLALAASWDPTLAHDYGAQIAKELRVLGISEGLGGGVDLARELRNGRTFEYMGEDPVLAGYMSAARTQGTQEQKVIATIKHYAANDQETNRYTSNSIIDERTLRELTLLPFEIGVKVGQPGNVMCAYNMVNGVKSCQNSYLLTDVLKDEWGFKGKVQADWFFAITDTVQAANAGVDEEPSGSTDDTVGFMGLIPTFFNQKLEAAVTAGSVPMSRLNDMVQRRLRTLIRVGIMDSPAPLGGTIDQAAGDTATHNAAVQTMVLLKNATPAGSSTPALPLNASTIHSIVVIGGHADVGVLAGGGSALTPPRHDFNPVTCLVATSTMIATGIPACATYYNSAPLAAIMAKAPNATVTYLDGSDANAAAAAAAAADVAIVFGTQFESEGADLSSLSLPNNTTDPANQAYDQNALIAAVAASAKRSIVVLENGTAVTMPWIDNVHAVLDAWYPGMQGGAAIADVLFGTVNPSGKLPITFPMADTDQPQKEISATNTNVVYSEGLQMGYRWYDAQNIQPLFPFGYGLSYTTFGYSGLSTSVDGSGNLTATLTVTNTGKVDGAEVVELYAALPPASGEPPRRLIGWQKVQLAAGSAKQITINASAERLAIWDVTLGQWRIPAGAFTFYAASSSRDSGALTSTQNLSGKVVPISD
jgi:beta-glucosidase